MPIFNGKEDKDIGDWIRQFEVMFTASGKNDDGNDTKKVAIAATCLKGLHYNSIIRLGNGNHWSIRS
jgi:hypothetical protein